MRKTLWIVPILLLAGCSKNQQNNRQPVGSAQAAMIAPAANPTPNPDPAAAAAPAAPDPAPTAEAIIPRGTPLRARIDESLSTRRNRPGDRFTATLTDPVVVNGQQVLPSGTRLEGRVLVARPSGRLEGRARLVLALDSIDRDGRRYSIDTTVVSRVSRSHKRRNLLAIGGTAGAGASVGAIAAGGVGAAVGAGAGAVAGTVGAAVTGRKQVYLPAESVVRFTLGAPARV